MSRLVIFSWKLGLLFSTAAFGHDVHSAATSIAVGRAPGLIGLEAAPNQACRGPSAVSAASGGRLAVLDGVNNKIVVLGGAEPQDVPLPASFVEPVDLLSTTRGYVVLSASGASVHVDATGELLAQSGKVHNPEDGELRLISLANGQLAYEDLAGNRTSLDLGGITTGLLTSPGLVAESQYTISISEDGRLVSATAGTDSRLATFSVRSAMRVARARVIWAEEGQGALIALQETRRLPEEGVFMRLVRFSADGRGIEEAYLDSDAFSCETARSFSRLTTGGIASLVFGSNSALSLRHVAFLKLGLAKPKPISSSTEAALISSGDENTYKALEKLNGTTTVDLIGMSIISRGAIVKRAQAALTMEWVLSADNHSHVGLESRCAPVEHIWQRPQRLETMVGQQIVGVPYRWGGYVKSLTQFHTDLSSGRLAGDVCACRTANCVHPAATGMDCSGFASFAWDTGKYLTTISLPNQKVSKRIEWSEVGPGDLVNSTGRHVRLVETVRNGKEGRLFTVIESTTKRECGGVCRRTYTEADLQLTNYKPLRRIGLTP